MLQTPDARRSPAELRDLLLTASQNGAQLQRGALFEVFNDDLKTSGIKGLAAGALDFHDALAQAASLKVGGAVDAVGVVAGFAQEAMRGPGAARFALRGVVAGTTKTPEVLDGALAQVLKLRRGRDRLGDAQVAHVGARVVLGGI